MERQHWTARIPWWLGWLFVGGMGLVSMFGSNVLPATYQLLGFLVGCVAMFIAAAGTLVHVINDCHRVPRGKEPLRLAPHHLIIIGLVIALAGVIWQQWPHTKPDEAAASPPRAEKPVISPETLERRKFYSTRNKNDLADAMTDVSSILNTAADGIATKTWKLQQDWDQRYRPGVPTADLMAALITQLDDISADTVTLNKVIYDDGGLIKKYSSYPDEIDAISSCQRTPHIRIR